MLQNNGDFFNYTLMFISINNEYLQHQSIPNFDEKNRKKIVIKLQLK